MIAFVSARRCLRTSSGSRHRVSSRTSTIFEVQLFQRGTTAVVIKEIVGLMISQSLIPNALKTKSCPLVALLTATAYLAPTSSANFFSNSATLGPLPHHPLSIDSLREFNSSSPPTGRRTGSIVSRIFISFLFILFQPGDASAIITSTD